MSTQVIPPFPPFTKYHVKLQLVMQGSSAIWAVVTVAALTTSFYSIFIIRQYCEPERLFPRCDLGDSCRRGITMLSQQKCHFVVIGTATLRRTATGIQEWATITCCTKLLLLTWNNTSLESTATVTTLSIGWSRRRGNASFATAWQRMKKLPFCLRFHFTVHQMSSIHTCWFKLYAIDVLCFLIRT